MLLGGGSSPSGGGSTAVAGASPLAVPHPSGNRRGASILGGPNDRRLGRRGSAGDWADQIVRNENAYTLHRAEAIRRARKSMIALAKIFSKRREQMLPESSLLVPLRRFLPVGRQHSLSIPVAALDAAHRRRVDSGERWKALPSTTVLSTAYRVSLFRRNLGCLTIAPAKLL